MLRALESKQYNTILIILRKYHWAVAHAARKACVYQKNSSRQGLRLFSALFFIVLQPLEGSQRRPCPRNPPAKLQSKKGCEEMFCHLIFEFWAESRNFPAENAVAWAKVSITIEHSRTFSDRGSLKMQFLHVSPRGRLRRVQEREAWHLHIASHQRAQWRYWHVPPHTPARRQSAVHSWLKGRIWAAEKWKGHSIKLEYARLCYCVYIIYNIYNQRMM